MTEVGQMIECNRCAGTGQRATQQMKQLGRFTDTQYPIESVGDAPHLIERILGMKIFKSVGRAFSTEDQSCVYAYVSFGGVDYCVQISRPRHPSNIGQYLGEGADIMTDEGHDDNQYLRSVTDAMNLDWSIVVAQIVQKSGAESALACGGAQ